MQKKIIALAVAGLVSGAAFAQSNVTVYGLMDIGYLDSNTDQKVNAGNINSGGGQSNSGYGNGALSTSRLGFKGSEDLGNSLKANFIYELNILDTSGASSTVPQTDTASFTTRLAQIGLSGTWGSFDIGRQEGAVAKNVWTMGSATLKNNAVGSLFDANSGIRMAEARYSSVMTYTSPSFSGFQVSGQYGTATNEADTIATGVKVLDSEFDVINLSATYSAGPLSLGLGYSESDGSIISAAGVSGDANKKEAWLAAVSYDFGIAKIFGMYTDGSNDLDRNVAAGTALSVATSTGLSNNTADSLTDVDGWELGVQVPYGQFTFAGSYFNGDRNYRTNVTNLKYNADVDGFQLAALYSLSKRTTAYAMYGEVNNDFSRVNSVQKSNDTQQWAIGLKHTF
jgi:predicted porin